MFATIYTPNFYLQAALRHRTEPPTNPVALIETQERKAIIVQLNEAAEQAGVRKGMTPSQALARCLQVAIKTRARVQERLIDEIVLHYAFTLAPYVEATSPGVCTIQFTDDRDLPRKVSRVIEQLKDCEITAQAGIADKPDLSFLAAHLAKPILKVEDAKNFLAPLPIETLAIVT
jgi:nucleotidyltransferase/DNA polymerase involved in DNA repair